jgi:hypothetical protein
MGESFLSRHLIHFLSIGLMAAELDVIKIAGRLRANNYLPTAD